MNEREYKKQLNEIENNITLYTAHRNTLMKSWWKACKHPLNRIDFEVNYYDDEYGSPVNAWTDYDYTCSRCDTRLRNVKKRFVEGQEKELQAALTKAAHERNY